MNALTLDPIQSLPRGLRDADAFADVEEHEVRSVTDGLLAELPRAVVVEHLRAVLESTRRALVGPRLTWERREYLRIKEARCEDEIARVA